MYTEKALNNKINEYYVRSKVKYQAHKKAAEKYNDLYYRTTYPSIIVSTIASSLASFNILNLAWLAPIVAVVSILSTVIQSLTAFFEYKNKYQEHKIVSDSYMRITRSIEKYIYGEFFTEKIYNNVELREEYIKSFFDRINKDFNGVESKEPVLPSDIANLNILNTKIGNSEVDDVLIDMSDTEMFIPNFKDNLPSVNLLDKKSDIINPTKDTTVEHDVTSSGFTESIASPSSSNNYPAFTYMPANPYLSQPPYMSPFALPSSYDTKQPQTTLSYVTPALSTSPSSIVLNTLEDIGNKLKTDIVDNINNSINIDKLDKLTTNKPDENDANILADSENKSETVNNDSLSNSMPEPLSNIVDTQDESNRM